MKYLITFLFILTSFIGFSQESGVAVLYQQIGLGEEYYNTHTNTVFFGDKHVVVNTEINKETYHWKDSITSITENYRECDLDQDGTVESIGIRTYYASNGGIYKLVIRDGSPVMTTASTPSGERVVFAGCLKQINTTLERVEEVFNGPPILKGIR